MAGRSEIDGKSKSDTSQSEISFMSLSEVAVTRPRDCIGSTREAGEAAIAAIRPHAQSRYLYI
jgi:hypothetical protein